MTDAGISFKNHILAARAALDAAIEDFTFQMNNTGPYAGMAAYCAAKGQPDPRRHSTVLAGIVTALTAVKTALAAINDSVIP